MLSFLSQYPIGYYLKTFTNPKRKACNIGLYLSPDVTMMLLKKKNPTFWSGRLKETPGAPTLENTVPRGGAGIVGAMLPTTYRKEIVQKQGLDKFNDVTIIVDDPESYTQPYSVTTFETAGELESVLIKDPGSIISAWKNYSQNREFIWEILSPDMTVLREGARLPKKVILCGFPEERAIYTAKWLESMNNELVDLIPVVPAILRWAVENGPEEGFFLLIQNANEIAISYIEKKQVQMINTQKTKEGFTTDEIADVNELVAEIGRDTPTPIWCWGIMPGSTAYAKLSARYPLIKSLTAEELQKIKPLEIVNNDEPIVEREAWLLDAMMG
jgi:hypothetical protein